MADYYPLLARALDALPDRSPALRKAVYDRARHALISQLRSLEPPLSEDDIDLERRALDAAIDRLEVDHGGVPAPANDAAQPAPAPIPPPAAQPVVDERNRDPEPAPVPEAAPEPEPPPALPEPSPPEAPVSPPIAVLPPASAPSFGIAPAEPALDPEPREAPIPIAARKPRSASAEPPAPDAAETVPAAEAPPPAESANGRLRPRIAVIPPKTDRSHVLRNAAIGTVLAVVIGLIAVAAFLLRDKPQTLPPTGSESAATQQPDGSEAKFGDRVGGDAGAPERSPAPRQGSGTAPRGDAVPAQAGVSVAQRAVLLEETSGGENAQPTTTTGRVTWRLETANGEQAQPLQNAVVATVTYPDAGLTLVMTLRRNLDATLPASHTVSLSFTQTGAEAASRSVQDVGLLQAKDDEAGRGSPVSGLPVRVRENLFLIGLSSLPADVERNTDLLLRRNWFDLAVRYTSGRRAVLTFEKGASGAQVMQSAFDAWR